MGAHIRPFWEPELTLQGGLVGSLATHKVVRCVVFWEVGVRLRVPLVVVNAIQNACMDAVCSAACWG